jgi:hypothetical protein
MTGAKLKSIREAFGLSAAEMGRALGYRGPRSNVAIHIRRLERDAPPNTALRREARFDVCPPRHP